MCYYNFGYYTNNCCFGYNYYGNPYAASLGLLGYTLGYALGNELTGNRNYNPYPCVPYFMPANYGYISCATPSYNPYAFSNTSCTVYWC